ncbi:MAG TPA: class I lanthipeptide [Candidatus Deferrimicrobium sp.]|nr:class I lanthipeptide [Candidatus Kapabacteria bacterium]HLP58600.1 class I lanthipeptide [Candidatus Deferrimicrobium sp.]
MKKKKLKLQKVTVANLNIEMLGRVKGGYTAMAECSIPNPDSNCPAICGTGDCGTSGQSNGITCELYCTTLTPNTCRPCIP